MGHIYTATKPTRTILPMKKGKLSKPELRKLGRAYGDLNEMILRLPTENLCEAEKATLEALTKSRNGIGEILRWQDFDGVWKEVSAPKPAVA